MSAQLTQQALTILNARYLLRDEQGNVVENSDGMFRRVARHVASVEKDAYKWTEIFDEYLSELRFLPNSPCLANAGKVNGQLSACFVIPVGDSIEEIFRAISDAALIHKTGGGTGFNFSNLRRAGGVVKSTGQIASGPVSFMRVFDAATGAIKQGGVRRGANIGLLRVDHPDILEFIHCKDGGGLENFNISVMITDEFMKAVDGRQSFKGEGGRFLYRMEDPSTGLITSYKDARKVWKEIAESAWRTGDPGLVFIDKMNNSRANPVTGWKIEAVNPCGEQPLYSYDSCNLGSINLALAVTDNKVDYEYIRQVVEVGVRFLDDMIDANYYTLPQIEDMTKAIRRIGLGVMGWADLLTQLEIPYDSDEAVDTARIVAKTIKEAAYETSSLLGVEKGGFDKRGVHSLMRNCTVTTIAPTGTISLIAGCSSGIEPLFAREYRHHGLEGQITDTIVNRYYLQHKENSHPHEPLCNKCPKTAREIDWRWHIAHQDAFQCYTDNAVSKTINLPRTATVKDIASAYLKAYEGRCLGITVFRDGCRDGPLEDVEEKEEITEVSESTPVQEEKVARTRRPKALDSLTYKQATPFGNMYVTISEHDGVPYELFATIGKAGSDVQSLTEALGRAVSTFLREGGLGDQRAFLARLEEQWQGIGGSLSKGFGVDRVTSIPDALSKVIGEYLGGERSSAASRDDDVVVGGMVVDGSHQKRTPSLGTLCPECMGFSLERDSGCDVCYSCGYSRC